LNQKFKNVGRGTEHWHPAQTPPLVEGLRLEIPELPPFSSAGGQ